MRFGEEVHEVGAGERRPRRASSTGASTVDEGREPSER